MALSSHSDAPVLEKKLTAADIARDWDCSRAYVSACIKKGCPSDSLESARAWRLENSKYGVGYRSKKPKPIPGNPAAGSADKSTSQEKADLTTPESSLSAAIEVEQEAYRLVKEAQQQRKDELISVRIQAYNRAQANRLDAQKRVQEILEKEQVLVPMDTAKAIIRKVILPLLNRLRSISKRAGLKANPADDLHAETVIQEEIEAAIAETRAEQHARS